MARGKSEFSMLCRDDLIDALRLCRANGEDLRMQLNQARRDLQMAQARERSAIAMIQAADMAGLRRWAWLEQ